MLDWVSCKNLGKFAIAAFVYAGFAVYLYQPYFKHFDKLQYLLFVNACMGALGCFMLSRRWVSSCAGSFFAGAVYGFGPFLLGLGKFHPTGGFLAAAVPWLFLPAAFGPGAKWRWLSWPLSALPFGVIILFFQSAGHFGFFPVPAQAKLHLADLAGLAVPMVMATKDCSLIGLYHVPIAALVMGSALLLAARRYGLIIIFCSGLILAFWPAFFGVSPIIWMAIPLLCCSVFIAAGTQGLISAGIADKKWVLGSVIVMGTFAVVVLALTGYGKLYSETAKMYILGTIAIAIVFFMAKTNFRARIVRITVISSAMAIDIFLSARFIVDQIF